MFGVSDSSATVLAEALAKRWEGRQIVMLVDEFNSKAMLNKLVDQSFPDSVRMIFVLNALASEIPRAS